MKGSRMLLMMKEVICRRQTSWDHLLLAMVILNYGVASQISKNLNRQLLVYKS